MAKRDTRKIKANGSVKKKADLRAKHLAASTADFRKLTGDLSHNSKFNTSKTREMEAMLGVLLNKSQVSGKTLRTFTSPVDDALEAVNKQISGEALSDLESPLNTAILDELDTSLNEFAKIDSSKNIFLSRRSLSTDLIDAVNPASIETRNIRAGLRFGPFTDRFQRDIFIDLFQPAKKIALKKSPSGPGLLLATKARISRRSNTRINLQKGTIWILAKSLNNAAPTGAYIGIRILRGVIDLSTAPIKEGDDLILSNSNSKFVLKLELEHPEPENERTKAAPPKKLELKFSPQGKVEKFAGAASIDDIDFAFKGTGKIKYDARQKHIEFMCDVKPEQLETSRLKSTGGQFKGNVSLSKGFWAVPITLPSSPADLGESDGENSWNVRVDTDFETSWAGGPKTPSIIKTSVIVIKRDGFIIDGLLIKSGEYAAKHEFLLWKLPASKHRLKLNANLDPSFQAVIGWRQDVGPFLIFDAHCAFDFLRPITAIGKSAKYADAEVKIFITGKASDQKLFIIRRKPVDVTGLRKRQMLVMENLFLACDQLEFAVLAAKLKNGSDTYEGVTGFHVPVLGWIPILPDPYVDNLCLNKRGLEGRERLSILIALFKWQDGEAEFGFFGLVKGLSARLCSPSKGGSRASRPDDRPPVYPGQTHQGQFLDARKTDNFFRALHPSEQPSTPLGSPSEASQLAQRQFAGAEKQSRLRVAGPMLLDVSTAKHQIGVQMIAGERGQSASIAAARPQLGTGQFLISKSRLGAPLSALRVFALPQIQWEPVRTLDKDQDPITLGIFPTPLASPDDGGATVIGSNTAKLSPVIPDLTLDEVLREFEGGHSFGVVTTLPFGMKTLFLVDSNRTASRQPDTAEYVQPKFESSNGLQGGLQLSLRSQGGIKTPGQESPSFRGLAVQTLNGVDLSSGSPLNISVLGSTAGSAGSVESLFNSEFAVAKPRAPITRYDISGYGASIFSDWANPRGSYAETTRAQFQVLVGRTALEVVKVASIVYPWGIRVTRSVTIERKGGGGVLRKDSGWQAQSPGIFDFTTDTVPSQPFEFHPGLIRGVYNVTRIRPLANEGITLPGAGKVLPIAFDADVKLDGKIGSGLTSTKSLTGYLHLEPLGGPISPEALAALIDHQGAIGGPIDDMINVGGSGFKTRALRIEIDAAAAPSPAPGNIGFVGAVRTSPKFGAAGSWSVSQASPPGGPAPHDATAIIDGAPLIRMGKANTSPDEDIRAPMIGPYRFADAKDLYQAASPDLDYGFIQSDTTHRFLFRRPIIEPGAKIITSTLSPVIVDFFAATSSKGLFPPIDKAIELTDEPYHLTVDQTSGYLGLAPPVHNLRPPRGQLVLSDTSTDRFRVEYNDATLNFDLSPTDWSFNLDRVELWTDAGDWDNLNGTRVTLQGGEGRRPELDKIETLMNPIMEDMFKILPFMNNRGTHGPIDFGATNVKVGVKLSAGVDTWIPDPENPYAAIRLFALFELGFEADFDKLEGAYFIGGKTGYEARFSIPINPYPVAVIFGWSVTLGGKVLLSGPDAGKAKGLIEVRIYVGLAFGKDLTIAKATVATGAGLLIVGGSSGSGLGGFIFLEIKAKITPIVSIKLFGEFACLQVDKAGDKYNRWQGQIGYNISIFMIISIKGTWNVSDEKKIS